MRLDQLKWRVPTEYDFGDGDSPKENADIAEHNGILVLRTRGRWGSHPPNTYAVFARGWKDGGDWWWKLDELTAQAILYHLFSAEAVPNDS